jgi:hypothetical protein
MSLNLSLGLSLSNVAAMGGGAPFTPTDLGASLLEWWDAEDATKLTLSGSDVVTWTGKVGGLAPTQSTGASRPLYSATSFNNRPGLTFDGVADHLFISAMPFPANCEIWCLVDQTALAADATVRTVFATGGNTGGASYQVRRAVNTINNAGANNGSATSAYNAADFSGRHIVRGVFSATGFSMAVDGNTAVSAVSATTLAATRTRIGANTASTASAFFQGVINTIMVTAPLTTNQADNMWDYMGVRGDLFF